MEYIAIIVIIAFFITLSIIKKQPPVLQHKRLNKFILLRNSQNRFFTFIIAIKSKCQ